MQPLPVGIVTFLFTDIEGSTRLWEMHPVEMDAALAAHDAILQEAIGTNHGHLIKTTGDGAHAVFPTAGDALKAALAAQHFLNQIIWLSGQAGFQSFQRVHPGFPQSMMIADLDLAQLLRGLSRQTGDRRPVIG